MAKEESTKGGSGNSKRTYVSQTDIPRLPLPETVRIAEALRDDFAAKGASPHQVAMSVDMSPTSSGWRKLCGASIGYGLTDGGARAEKIELTDLGKRLVIPTSEGDDLRARVEAILQPTILRRFFEKYNKAKLPSDKIAVNVLRELGVPDERLQEALDIVKRNGDYAGIVHQTKTGPFVAIETPISSDEKPQDDSAEEEAAWAAGVPVPREASADVSAGASDRVGDEPADPPGTTAGSQRVFITHGKNTKIVEQLKELLTFGKFEAVVAEEHHTPSKPVPDKVLDEMRSCFAGIIHVESEDELSDDKGKVHHKLNENVLIEIGAALALYKRNVILLVHEGVQLPSNLQGLYRCDYEGPTLDYDATMKLLKACNEFE